MKKLLLLLALLFYILLFGESAWAGDARKVIVTEMVPGAECVCIRGVEANGQIQYDATGLSCGGSVINRKYECTIQSGLAGFQNMFATIIRWIINIVLLIGVLSIVGLGIAWSLAGGDDAKAKSELKKWAMNIMVGLIILFFFQYILKFLAPWIYA